MLQYLVPGKVISLRKCLTDAVPMPVLGIQKFSESLVLNPRCKKHTLPHSHVSADRDLKSSQSTKPGNYKCLEKWDVPNETVRNYFQTWGGGL